MGELGPGDINYGENRKSLDYYGGHDTSIAEDDHFDEVGLFDQRQGGQHLIAHETSYQF